MIHTLLAWLYWNPPRNVFTVPFLDRPVAWYGLLFVTGFILGYFIIIPIFSRFLRDSKKLCLIDIVNWPLLIEELQTTKITQNPIAGRVFQGLNSYLRNQLRSSTPADPIDSYLKRAILKSINRLWQSQSLQRVEIEKAFPGAIAPVSHTSHFLADRLCWFIVAGTLIGARLGAVFFYDWDYFKSHPAEIFKVWNGGLASHGGTLGVFIALYLYVLYIKKWVPSISLLSLMDCVVIPTPLAACFIRLGNFVNQEILGTSTLLPWGIIFGAPADGSAPTPRHPIQLYEALGYFVTFIILYVIWKKGKGRIGSGLLSGLMFLLIFSSRFVLEFWKETQESILDISYLQIGQLLSVPFIIFGLYLIWYSIMKPPKSLQKKLVNG